MCGQAATQANINKFHLISNKMLWLTKQLSYVSNFKHQYRLGKMSEGAEYMKACMKLTILESNRWNLLNKRGFFPIQ